MSLFVILVKCSIFILFSIMESTVHLSLEKCYRKKKNFFYCFIKK